MSYGNYNGEVLIDSQTAALAVVHTGTQKPAWMQRALVTARLPIARICYDGGYTSHRVLVKLSATQHMC